MQGLSLTWLIHNIQTGKVLSMPTNIVKGHVVYIVSSANILSVSKTDLYEASRKQQSLGGVDLSFAILIFIMQHGCRFHSWSLFGGHF